MNFAHERGVIHRDLKPANVLLSCNPKRQRGSLPSHESDRRSTLADASGYMADMTLPIDDSWQDGATASSLPQPKISDFGLARLLNSDSGLTATGQVIGTPSYMAPEQAGELQVDAGPALDVYSLGAIMYESLTGRPPFQGATILQTLDLIQQQEPVAPRQLQPSVPVDLETICLKCLEKSPTRRYSTALDLADDLGRFLRHESIAARPSGTIERTRKWIRRRPAVAALLSLIVVLTVVGWSLILHEADRANTAAEQATLNAAAAQRDSAEATRQRFNADAERVKAREAQARAEANFVRAVEVVRRVSDLGEQLRSEPQQQRTSGALFETALMFFENVLVERGDDPAVRHQAGTAFWRAGEMRMMLGQHDKAAKQLERAVELLDMPIDETAGDHERLPLHRDFATSLRLRAKNCQQLGELETAEAVYRRFLAVNASLAKRLPEEEALEVQQESARVGLSTVLAKLNRKQEAEAGYQQAIEALRTVLSRDQRFVACKTELGIALDNFGNLLWSQKRTEEAKPLLVEAFLLRQRLLNQFPSSRELRIMMSRSLRSLATCDAATNNVDEAVKRMEDGCRMMRRVFDEFPDEADVRVEALAVARQGIELAIQHGSKPHTNALVLEDRVLKLMVRDAPRDVSLRKQEAESSLRLGESYFDRSDHVVALEHYTRALNSLKVAMLLTPDDAETATQAAWWLAVCPAPEVRDQKLALQFARRAVEHDAKNAMAWLSLGAAALGNSDTATAESALRKAIELSDLKTQPKESANVLLARLRESLGLGNGSSPHDESSPHNLAARALLVQTLMKQTRPDDARKEFTEITKRLRSDMLGNHTNIKCLIREAELAVQPPNPSKASM
jgi:tetratricopeptide (TPR) repeat protein